MSEIFATPMSRVDQASFLEREERSGERFSQIWNEIADGTKTKIDPGRAEPVYTAPRFEEKKPIPLRPISHHEKQKVGSHSKSKGVVSQREDQQDKTSHVKEERSQGASTASAMDGATAPTERAIGAVDQRDHAGPDKIETDATEGKPVAEAPEAGEPPRAIPLLPGSEKSLLLSGEADSSASDGRISLDSKFAADGAVSAAGVAFPGDPTESVKKVLQNQTEETLKLFKPRSDSENNPSSIQTATISGAEDADPSFLASGSRETGLASAPSQTVGEASKTVSLASSERRGSESHQTTIPGELSLTAVSSLAERGEREGLGERSHTPFDMTSKDQVQAISSDSPDQNPFGSLKVETPVSTDLSIQAKGGGEAPSSNSIPDGQKILQQIAEKLSLWRPEAGHSIKLRLEPETLGSLRIEISIHGQEVSADIVTKHSFVKDLLDENQGALRQTLAEYGFKVDRFDVNVGDPGGRFPDFQRSPWNKPPDPFEPADRAAASPPPPLEFGANRGANREGVLSGINLYI